MFVIVKKGIGYGVWFLVFAIFSFEGLFYITKDALPGEKLYPTKLRVEKIIATSSYILNKQVDLQMEFINNRLYETTKVLSSKQASESLTRLDSQVEITAGYITQIKNPKEREVAAKKYVVQLNHASVVLKNEQITLQQNSSEITNPTTSSNTNQPVENNNNQLTAANIATQIPVAQPTTFPTQTMSVPASEPPISAPSLIPTSVPTSTTVQQLTQNQQVTVVEQLQQTQQNINNTIEQMNSIINPNSGNNRKGNDDNRRDNNGGGGKRRW
ncbi:MAG: Conserved oligomeric Golgi complex subunit 8 [Candidatus Roizmanbacteria bacterium GW2011_GWA2_34_18]|uniref:Conserved oligomeric Golgi complex subunit 8 n=1 Tax=Candidatus Roizmanbacteria bacterium GW2011_GWA2_34_18 TaxID=1618477 RepID=A0A0G0AQQ2_9BACT|nr:MAG: Conserved oligomeric Golgi complex subunit 8 [Candidatus Roizmanbacteria bacterium GW2011_GWA2_34_18]